MADITNLSATVDGQAVTLESLGRFDFTPTTSRRVELVVTTDAYGRVGHSSTAIKTRDPEDTTVHVNKHSCNPSLLLDLVIPGKITDI